jgi:hypothetical protein
MWSRPRSFLVALAALAGAAFSSVAVSCPSGTADAPVVKAYQSVQGQERVVAQAEAPVKLAPSMALACFECDGLTAGSGAKGAGPKKDTKKPGQGGGKKKGYAHPGEEDGDAGTPPNLRRWT